MRFYKVIFLIFYFLLFCSHVHTISHYVDKNAKGNNSGTSWANAWESFSDIDWSQIQPGDTLFISGGTDSTIYRETLEPQCKGTAANPITFIAGKYAPSPSGHSGKVIIEGDNTLDYGIFISDYGGTIASYLTFKGLDIRETIAGVYINADNSANCLIFDSLYIYDFVGHAGIKIEADPVAYAVDSTIIRNCRIVSHPNYDGQTDGIFMKGTQHTVIHDNYIRVPNQDPYAHNNVLQGYLCNGFVIYNNVLINDSVYSPEGGGIPIMLGSQGTNPVIIYNNFIYMGGVWMPGANMAAVLCTRWYDTSTMPPTWIIHNTVVANGPYIRGVWQEYTATCINNIIAMWCPVSRQSDMMDNLDGYSLPSPIVVDSIRNNLFWKDGLDIGFDGQYTGNGNTGEPTGWADWVSRYGGTGVNADPLFVHNIGNEPDQGSIDGELQSSSPAINQGEDIQWLIESFGLPWTDINGNPRDNTPTIGAYEFVP